MDGSTSNDSSSIPRPGGPTMQHWIGCAGSCGQKTSSRHPLPTGHTSRPGRAPSCRRSKRTFVPRADCLRQCRYDIWWWTVWSSSMSVDATQPRWPGHIPSEWQLIYSSAGQHVANLSAGRRSCRRNEGATLNGNKVEYIGGLQFSLLQKFGVLTQPILLRCGLAEMMHPNQDYAAVARKKSLEVLRYLPAVGAARSTPPAER